MDVCSLRPPMSALAVLIIFTIPIPFSFSTLHSQTSTTLSPPTSKPPPLPKSSLISPPPPKLHSPPPPPTKHRPPPPKYLSTPPPSRRHPPSSERWKPPEMADSVVQGRKRRGLNLGMKVGLLFSGIAVMLQIAVVGFLSYKKKQLYRVRY